MIKHRSTLLALPALVAALATVPGQALAAPAHAQDGHHIIAISVPTGSGGGVISMRKAGGQMRKAGGAGIPLITVRKAGGQQGY